MVDTLALGASARKGMRVRVSPAAPLGFSSALQGSLREIRVFVSKSLGHLV